MATFGIPPRRTCTRAKDSLGVINEIIAQLWIIIIARNERAIIAIISFIWKEMRYSSSD